MKVSQKEIYLPTGNDQVSIPTLYTDGSIENINVLSMKYKGLIEFCGDAKKPLIKPVLKVNGEPIQSDLDWKRIDYWIPQFTNQEEGVTFSGKICAPVGERGFYYQLYVKNQTSEEKKVELGLEGWWQKTLHSINESKEMRAYKHIKESNWNHDILFELQGETPLFALAPMADDESTTSEYHKSPEDYVYYKIGNEIELAPGQEKQLTIYWGVGVEEVGAATAAKEMLRKGHTYLENKTHSWLKERMLETDNQRLNEILNLNSFFNLFFATGTTIDTEELVLVTSRSPRYYVSAAYWDRDSLLWSFPAVLLVDHKRAKEMLDYVFTTQSKNIGIHSRYIDGVVLEPGFELDELCAPILALSMYIQETNDWAYLQEPYIRKTLHQIMLQLELQKHETIPLYETFLQPTDDPVVYPYLTYNNVLVWKTLNILSDFTDKIDLIYTAETYREMASEVKQAIYQHMMKEEDEYPVFVWSVDLEGNYNIYDEPPGSLQLLVHYGFCSKEDVIYQNTVNVIKSSKYLYSFEGYPFEELGCAHAEHPWLLSVGNSLLSGNEKKAIDLLLRAPLDGGIACESFDEYTGESRTGEHFATCAGFLAYSLYTSL
ncbi:glycoside hydrolase family 125 protein [Bacillaceae bacterium S4-13-58]